MAAQRPGALLTPQDRTRRRIFPDAAYEIQWDWNELPNAPWGETAHLLVGTLSHSSRGRGVFAEAEDQAHLAEG
ncbi:MAG TPA: IS21 family transposase, partial [Candidatus Dormibacteraeota bacterium]|nr:IS21 family transposase [Candidatus Dormibacteraeota bacterium]